MKTMYSSSSGFNAPQTPGFGVGPSSVNPNTPFPHSSSKPAAGISMRSVEAPSFFAATPKQPKTQSFGQGLGMQSESMFSSDGRLNDQNYGTPAQMASPFEPRSGVRGNAPAEPFSGMATFSGLRNRRSKPDANFITPFEEPRSKGQTSPERSGILVDSEQSKSIGVPPAMSLLDLGSTATVAVPQQSLAFSTDDQAKPSRLGLDLGLARGLGVSSPAVTSGATVQKQKNQWVTVFGYPIGAGAEILSYFQGFGEVHEHRAEPGNWMHILYASPIHASRALAQNGQYVKIGESTIMIGVKPCSDLELGVNKRTSRSVSSKQFKQPSSSRLEQPEELRYAPQKAASLCKRFWKWVLDW